MTLEAIANDDLGALRDIPRRLGRAASQTLHEFAFDFLKDNPTIYDSTALFHATHGSNLGSTALDSAPLAAGRLAMKKQADMSNAKRLGISPKFLVVPADLEQKAYELTATDREVASANNTLNFIRTFGLTVIVVDYWTDTNNWYLVADPASVPTIALGFCRFGRGRRSRQPLPIDTGRRALVLVSPCRNRDPQQGRAEKPANHAVSSRVAPNHT